MKRMLQLVVLASVVACDGHSHTPPTTVPNSRSEDLANACKVAQQVMRDLPGEADTTSDLAQNRIDEFFARVSCPPAAGPTAVRQWCVRDVYVVLSTLRDEPPFREQCPSLAAIFADTDAVPRAP